MIELSFIQKVKLDCLGSFSPSVGQERVGRENFGLRAIMWGRLGVSPLRRFRGILRNREGLDNQE